MNSPSRGRLLGIDHGTKVIGLAICDANWVAARPLELLKRKTLADDFARINAIITHQQIRAIVVGLPELPPDLIATSQAKTVHRWATRLAAAVHIPVYFWDEQYSTQDVYEQAEEIGMRLTGRVDDRAAAVILQGFINAHPLGATLPKTVK